MTVAILVILLISAIYAALVLPRLINRADMTGLLEDYAHRGLHNEELPENSLGAFKNAVDHRFGIELDIQLSKDNVPMVFHDATLKRVCGIDAKLCEYTAEELGKIKLLDSEYTIPTFAEVLSLVDGRVPLLVEFKRGNSDLVEIACDMLDNYNGAFCVESFDPTLLMRIKKYRPKYARGQLVTNMFKADFSKNPVLNFCLTFMLFNFLARPDFIAFNRKYENNLSVLFCRFVCKTPMFAWTVKKKKYYDEYKAKSINSIFEKFVP